jgi:uncharacterized protein (UPF0276 family)
VAAEGPHAQLPDLGVGVGFRRELAAGIFAHADAIDFLEIISEHYLDPTSFEEHELDRLAARFPLVPHGLNLSVGTAARTDAAYLRALDRLVRRIDAPWWSDHLAVTHAGGIEIGHLAPVPLTRASLETVCRNVEHARAAVGAPFAIEHIASPLALAGAEMSEAAFLTELLERTGSGLLLDLMNVYANAWNHGGDPYAFLDALPLERIVYVHVVGGRVENGLMIDSHTSPAPQAVWEMLAYVARRTRIRGVLIEWDDCFPAFDVILEEVGRARSALRGRPLAAVAGAALETDA